MQKKSISVVVILTMLISLFVPFGEITYAATNDFVFNWERDKTIKSIVDIANRVETENELVLSWSYNKIIGGSDAYVGEYLLKYNLSDGEQIELRVDNSSDTMAQIKYRVKNLVNGTYKDASLKAYDANGQNRIYWKYQKGSQNGGRGQWVNENNSNEVWKNSTTGTEVDLENYKFKPTGISVEMVNDGKDIGPNITINKGSIATFVYDNKLVVLKLDEDGQNILLGMDSIERGKIYNFNISCNKGNQKYETSMDIFKLVEFKTDPVGENIIDKTQEGNETSHPGQDPVGMKIRVAIPYIWDDENNEFVNSVNKRYPDGIKAVVNLRATKTGEAIQVNIPNIYETSGCTINAIDPTKPDSKSNVELDGEPTITTENNKNYYTIFLKNMEASTLYNVANISLDVINNANETKLKVSTCDLAEGENAYTYLWYDTETKNTGERVLKIKPYNVSGTYVVYQSGTQSTLEDEEKSLIARKDWKATDTGEIEIPVKNDVEYYYMVKFIYELGELKSQILIDISDTSKYLVTPQLQVKSYEIITENKEDKVDHKLKITLAWSGGKKEVFDNLLSDGKSVIYEFAKTPFSPINGKYAKFFRLGIKSDGNGGYIFSKVSDKYTGDNWDTATILDTQSINQVASSEDGSQTININFETTLEFELFDEVDMDSRNEPSKVFYYPSIYYLKMCGSYINSLGKDMETPYCNPINVTLNQSSSVVLPPPQNPVLKNPATTSFELDWDTVTEAVYGDYINANDYDLQAEDGVAVNIFLTQLNVLAEEDADKQAAYFEYPNDNIVSVDYNKLVVKDEENKDYITLDMSSVIDSIRNNKMIRIFNLPQITNKKAQQAVQIVYLKGLDKNTVYYVALQTVLNVINKSDKAEKIVMSDKVSQITTITTKKEDPLNPPQPEEVAPEAPKDFKQDDTVEQLPTKITLSWTAVKEPTSIDGVNVKTEYEIVRVNKRLDDSLLNKRNSFDNFWTKDLSSTEIQKVAWQTVSSKVHPDNLLIYSGNDFISNTSDTAEKYQYEYANNPKLQFIDKTIMPNRLYYYYIRTVRMKEENGTYKEAAWSSWTPLSVTTATIKAPTDLKLERNDTYFTYNPESEIIISFFAPIPVGTSFADIASLYPLEYSIMKEDGKEEIYTMNVTNSSVFKKGNETKEGYQHYVYKITGLEAGKGYTLKVRMKSRVNSTSEATPIYDVSLYSNSVEFRTDMNQDEYDTEQGIKKWLKKFDDDLMALAAKAYWNTDNTDKSYTAIYRTKTFNSELQKATSGAYSFEAENQRSQTYYIPAGSITLSDTANTGYKAFKDNMDIFIRPDSFDSGTTDAILEAITKVKDGDWEDYFIEMNLEWSNTNENINGSTPLSEVVRIIINVVGSKKTEKELDNTFVNFFEVATSDSDKAKVRNELKKDLKEALEDEDTAEEIFKMVQDAVEEAYDDIIDDIDDEFDKATKGSISITSLAENMLITSSVNSQSSVSGYRKNNSTWDTIPTKDYGNKKGFETNLLGIFVFSGRIINIPDIAGIPNSNYVKEIIAKYGLDDYLGKDVIDSSRKATKYEVAGCIAKMAGADASANPVAYLKSKGINVTSAKLYNDISNQEAVYLIMSLYETKTGTKVSTIKITNYNTLENIKDASENYKKSLQVAIQLGICTDNSIAPKDTISVKDFLKYLGYMSQKINL